MASQSPPGAGTPGEPTEEEMRAYLAQLREADPAEIVAQAYTMLGTGAEVKLGRPDARTLIDALAGLVEAAEGKLSADLTGRMRSGVTQLQMAQVEAERQAAGQPQQEAGQQPGAGAGDQPAGEGRAAPGGQPSRGGQRPRAGQPSQAGQPSEAGQGTQGGDRPMTDRLWIPGRDPRPR